MRSIILIIVIASPALAQLPNPRLNTIYPCGAKQGTELECAITGGEIADATGLWFSHAGITAKPAGAGKFTVSVAKDVPVGNYDVRAVTPFGVSNFRAFVVGDVAEAIEKEPNDEPSQAQRITLPTVANGRIEKPTDVDHWVFAAKKGQRILINCWAWRIDSQLDGTMLVTDPQGKELAYSGDFYGRDPFIDFTAPADGDYTLKIWDFVYSGGNDSFYRVSIGNLPHIDAAIPSAIPPGKKTSVTIYGRNLPGGKTAPNNAMIQGRPLEVVVREVTAPGNESMPLSTGEAIRPAQAQIEGMAYRIATPEGSSNPVFLAFTNAPVVLEQEPNEDQATVQRLAVPCEVSGTFGRPGDRDTFSFPMAKGEKVVVEVFGQRHSGLIDPFLSFSDPTGKKLGNMGNGSLRNIGLLKFTTQSNDTRWELTAAMAGDHSVMLRDLYSQQRGEARFTYRLAVRKPTEDFRLIVSPSHDVQPDSTNVGQGGRMYADVFAFRQDGFDGNILVQATDLPPGVSCEPVTIGPGKNSAPLVFTAAPDAPMNVAAIRVTGTATIDGKPLVRLARGGGLAWPTVNTPGIARMADGIVIGVRPAYPFRVTATPATISAAAGEKVGFTVKVDRLAGWEGDVQIAGYDLPQNATVGLMTIAKNATEGKVELTLPAKLKAGTYTFTLNGAGQASRDFGRPVDPKVTKAANVRAVYPSNAITITVQ